MDYESNKKVWLWCITHKNVAKFCTWELVVQNFIIQYEVMHIWTCVQLLKMVQCYAQLG